MLGRRRRRRPSPVPQAAAGMDPVLLEIFDEGLAALRGDRAERMAEAMRLESATRSIRSTGPAASQGREPRT